MVRLVAQIGRAVEIDRRAMLDETDLPPPLQPENEIVL